MTVRFVVSPGGELRGEWRVPSDKSVSHRAVMLAALADGTSEISNILMSEDVRATINAVCACGVKVCEREDGRLTVDGGGLRAPAAEIDCGNSGTLMRLFCGVAAGWGVAATLIGDSSLMRRPMRRVAEPLAAMGADIRTAENGTPPVQIGGGAKLRGTAHTIDIASAQVKSALLLAGLRAEGETSVAEPLPTRDHTERMLEVFGAPVSLNDNIVSVCGGAALSPARFGVPADISSAAFLMVGAAISGGEMLLRETGINPTRIGVVELLRRMGARIEILNPRRMGAEPVADIRILGGELRGIDITAADVPFAIDEFPALLVAAAAAKGETTLSGAGELRHKESDRIGAMVAGLRTLGVECEETEDGLTMDGRGEREFVFDKGEVESRGDHRIAMAMAIAALRAKGDIIVRDCDNVATSFPGFSKQAIAAGLRLVEERD